MWLAVYAPAPRATDDRSSVIRLSAVKVSFASPNELDLRQAMNLDELRSNLSSVDRRLIELIAERQRLAGEIGRNKQSTGRATRDFEREKDVLEMARQQADSAAIDPNVDE